MFHANLNDLSGSVFGVLSVLNRATNTGHHVRWLCRCQCGTEKIIRADHLRNGKIKSCGCVKKTQDGLSKTREYSIWSKMIARCYRTENNNFKFYGGKGTRVCNGWRTSFADFVADVGKAPTAKHTLDRIKTTGHYSCGKCDECKRDGQPANCRWVTKDIQSRNQISNRYYTHDGKTLILKDWAKLAGINYLTLWYRLNSGMEFSKAIIPGSLQKIRTHNLAAGG